MEETYKIYARPNASGTVIKIFGSHFEQVKDGDVLIEETYDRHGANKYQVADENGVCNYSIFNGRLVERNKSADLEKIRKEKRILELKAKLSETDYNAIKFFENELTSAEYAPIMLKRKQWRSEINELEKP